VQIGAALRRRFGIAEAALTTPEISEPIQVRFQNLISIALPPKCGCPRHIVITLADISRRSAGAKNSKQFSII
jgi:hypothetical protein